MNSSAERPCAPHTASVPSTAFTRAFRARHGMCAMKMITSAPGRRQLCWHSLRARHATTEVIGVGRGAVDHESDGASVHMVGGESGMGVLVREDSGAKLRL